MKVYKAAGTAVCAVAFLVGGVLDTRAESITLRSSGGATTAQSTVSTNAGFAHSSVTVRTIGPDGKQTVVYQKDSGGALPGNVKSGQPGARLGVATSPVSEAMRAQLSLDPGVGLLVDAVIPGSAAARAKLAAHDVLTRFDNQILMSPAQLKNLVQAKKIGSIVPVTYLRAGREQTAQVAIESGGADSEAQVIDVGGFEINLNDVLNNLPDKDKVMVLTGGTNRNARCATQVIMGSWPAGSVTSGAIRIDLGNVMRMIGSGTNFTTISGSSNVTIQTFQTTTGDQ
jgi:hypothetical protein